MMRGLLNGFPQKRKDDTNRERLPDCGSNAPCKKPCCAEPLAQYAEEANMGAADNNSLSLPVSGNEPLISSELQQFVNDRVKSELMKSEQDNSLDVWVGKVVNSTLKANGVDLSSILVQIVLENIAQEASKQFLGVKTQAGASGSNTLSEFGSTSNEITLPVVANQSFPPDGPVDNSTEAITDINSTSEGKIVDKFMNDKPEMTSLKSKFHKRRVSAKREYPPFCGRNAPCPTEEERSRIRSGKAEISSSAQQVIPEMNKEDLAMGKEAVSVSACEMFPRMKRLEDLPRAKEVIGVSAREAFPKTKKLQDLTRGKEVIGASAPEFYRTKKLEDLPRPLKGTASNSVREIASAPANKILVSHVKPLNSIKGVKNVDTRNKVKETLALFRSMLEELSRQDKDMQRPDLKAAKMITKKGKESNSERQWIGSVPGVEVGDEFFYRAELIIVGIHRDLQGGIDYMKNGSKIVATSVIASGGYSDDMADPDVLIYSDQGGNIAGRNNEPPKDQKMETGNLALKNCISTKTQVRVTRGFENNSSYARGRITYTYDGLYTVEKYWSETGQHGKLVFKFELRRVPGQPRVAWRRG